MGLRGPLVTSRHKVTKHYLHFLLSLLPVIVGSLQFPASFQRRSVTCRISSHYAHCALQSRPQICGSCRFYFSISSFHSTIFFSVVRSAAFPSLRRGFALFAVVLVTRRLQLARSRARTHTSDRWVPACVCPRSSDSGSCYCLLLLAISSLDHLTAAGAVAASI